MKIAVGLNFYQCVDELKRLIPTIIEADVIYAIDGKYDVYNADNHLSTDGSREYLMQFPNVKIFDEPNQKQVKKRNRYFIEAGNDDCDWLLVVDSDIWFEGSWTMLRKHIQEIENTDKVRLWMPHYRELHDVPYIVTESARLYKYPMFWRYFVRHSNLTFMGITRKPSRNADDTVFGLLSRTDKLLRKPFRAQEGRECKIRNNRNESALAKKTNHLHI